MNRDQAISLECAITRLPLGRPSKKVNSLSKLLIPCSISWLLEDSNNPNTSRYFERSISNVPPWSKSGSFVSFSRVSAFLNSTTTRLPKSGQICEYRYVRRGSFLAFIPTQGTSSMSVLTSNGYVGPCMIPKSDSRKMYVTPLLLGLQSRTPLMPRSKPTLSSSVPSCLSYVTGPPHRLMKLLPS